MAEALTDTYFISMHALLRFIVYFLCFSVGCAIVLTTLFKDGLLLPLISYLQGVYEGQGIWTVLCLGLLQILIPLALTMRWLAVRRFTREITYTTANGRVSVNLQAIEEALSRAALNVTGVKHIVIRIYEDRIRRQVIIQAVLTLWDDNDIPATSQRAQDVLQQRFSELMPEQRSVVVQLSINKLNEQRGSEFIKAVQSDTTSITPGLSVTEGEIGNSAGRTLLQRTKRKRTDDGEIRERAETNYGDNDVSADAPMEDRKSTRVTEAHVDDDDDPYAELYHGPQYAVPGDDDESVDVSGDALPVDEDGR